MLPITSRPAVSGPAVTVQQISADTFTNPTSQHATQVEPDTFAYGGTIVAAFQTGRFTNGGASAIGYSVSHNGGATWTTSHVPGLTVFSSPPGPYDRASDPVVTYDVRHGVWLISSLALTEGGGGVRGSALTMSRSTDNGATWGAPVVAAAAPAPPVGGYDKQWVACDNTPASPHFGNCYLTWTHIEGSIPLLAARSTDGGLTWSAPQPTATSASGIGSVPLVRPDGTVVVLVTASDKISAYRSTDGGLTWTDPVSVSGPEVPRRPPAGLRFFTIPAADMDAAGTTYVAWHSCQFRPGCTANDIVMSSSPDGVAWSPPARVPTSPVAGLSDQFLPAIGVDPTSSGASARLGVMHYGYPDATCTAATCALNVRFVSSSDGGQSWTAPVQFNPVPMPLTWFATTSSGAMVGEYFGVTYTAGNPVAVFSMARPPTPTGAFDHFTAAARLAVGPPVPAATTMVAEAALVEVGPGLRVTFPRLSAVLRTADGGLPVVGRTVSFRAAGQLLCSAATDATGRATCGGLSQSLAVILATRYRASFAGDSSYSPSAADGPLLRALGLPLP